MTKLAPSTMKVALKLDMAAGDSASSSGWPGVGYQLLALAVLGHLMSSPFVQLSPQISHSIK